MLEAVIKAADKIDLVYMVDYRFELEASGWTHAWTVQTAKQKALLDAARKSLDDRLVALLRGDLMRGIARVTLQRTPQNGDRLLVASGKPKMSWTPPSADHARMLAEYEAFYREAGFQLRKLAAKVDAKRPHRLEIELAFGVRSDVSDRGARRAITRAEAARYATGVTASRQGEASPILSSTRSAPFHLATTGAMTSNQRAVTEVSGVGRFTAAFRPIVCESSRSAGQVLP